MEDKINLLTKMAEKRMAASRDPIHDLDHAKRVAQNTEAIATSLSCSPDQLAALRLAAWWHDAARTITKRPSIVWMPFVDDMLSAWILWLKTIRYGLFGSVAGLAVRLILCKSLGTGAIFTRIFLLKKNRILVDILKDADALDVVSVERAKRTLIMIQDSRMYHLGYRMMLWWFMSTKQLHMKTAIARDYLIERVKELIAWYKETIILHWHIEHFGELWVEKTIIRAELLIVRITRLSGQHLT